jgi:hypothetical protein
MLYDVIHSSQAEAAPDSPQAVGFLYNHGGLNNQKMAIVGLFLAAIERRSAVNLPYIYVKDQRTDDEYLAKFQDVFEFDAIAAFGRRHGVAVDPVRASGVRGGWEYFNLFCDALGTFPVRPAIEILLDALASLQPRIASNPVLRQLKNFVFASLGIQTAIQLRIEHDWQIHAQNLRANLGDGEDYAIGFMQILSKVRTTFPDLRLAYVTSDEKSMPASKDEIRTFSRSRFGIDLLWKSDLLGSAQLNQLNPLDLSMIDYEIARSCPVFIGQTASTFANILCLEKFARTRKDVSGHFIYNCLGEMVRERRDNGFSSSAHLALLPGRVTGAGLSENPG